MKKRPIDVWEYAGKILEALPKGILVTTKADQVDTMIIGWGSLGTVWGKAAFGIYIREGRLTREQLDKNPEFTVSIPLDEIDPKLVQLCGRNSGRNVDKIKEAGFTLVEGEKISVPAIKELPLTLECKVMYQQKQDISVLSEKYQNAFYPQDVDSSVTGANKDAHIMYFGRITAAYIIED